MIATCNNCEQFKVPWDDAGKAIMAEHVIECWIENPPVARSVLATTTKQQFILTDEEVEALLSFYSGPHFPDGDLVWGSDEAGDPVLVGLGALCHRLYHWYREHGNW